jgi:hypothetical protein
MLTDLSLAMVDYNIKSKLSSYTSVRDEQTKTQYAYNEMGFISYDDERAICDKTEYGIDNNLNGYIIWEISGDLMPDLSTPLLDAMNNRLNNTDVRCDSVDWQTLSPTMEGIIETASPIQLTGKTNALKGLHISPQVVLHCSPQMSSS